MTLKKKPTAEEKRVAEQKKLLKNKVVVQKNDFILGKTSVFTINDLKIFKLLISKVKSTDTLFTEFYEINTSEVKALNIKSAHLSEDIKKALKRLASIYVRIEKEGEHPKEVGLIKNEFVYPIYSKKILVSFSDDMRDYLLDIQGGYTKYNLLDIANFKLKHTLKMYEYFKSVSLKVMKIKPETLKERIDLIGKYNAFPEFRRNVIDPCVQEINDKTDTLDVVYTTVKEGKKVVFIVFHITRHEHVEDSRLLAEEKNKYSHLIGEECLYFNKYHTLDSLDSQKFIILLKEDESDNTHSILTSNEKHFDETLKNLFGEIVDIIDVEPLPATKEEEKTIDEKGNIEIKNEKDFKLFKSLLIAKYKGKQLLNNAPGFMEDTIIAVDETGLLVNDKAKKIITKEESFEVWKYLHKNRDKVGCIEKVTAPIKKFINETIVIEKKNALDMDDMFTYKVHDIKEEEEGMYRLYLNDVHDSETVELSKNLLNYKQLCQFMNEKSA